MSASGETYVISPFKYRKDGLDYNRIYNNFGDQKTFTRTERPQLVGRGKVTKIINKAVVGGIVVDDFDTVQYDRANNIDWLRGK